VNPTDPSGMLQLGARYYWPEVGRFLSQDPIGEGGNWYAYAAGNPVVHIDPTGEVWYKPWTWFDPKPNCRSKDPCERCYRQFRSDKFFCNLRVGTVTVACSAMFALCIEGSAGIATPACVLAYRICIAAALADYAICLAQARANLKLCLEDCKSQ